MNITDKVSYYSALDGRMVPVSTIADRMKQSDPSLENRDCIILNRVFNKPAWDANISSKIEQFSKLVQNGYLTTAVEDGRHRTLEITEKGRKLLQGAGRMAIKEQRVAEARKRALAEGRRYKPLYARGSYITEQGPADPEVIFGRMKTLDSSLDGEQCIILNMGFGKLVRRSMLPQEKYIDEQLQNLGQAGYIMPAGEHNYRLTEKGEDILLKSGRLNTSESARLTRLKKQKKEKVIKEANREVSKRRSRVIGSDFMDKIPLALADGPLSIKKLEEAVGGNWRNSKYFDPCLDTLTAMNAINYDPENNIYSINMESEYVQTLLKRLEEVPL